MRRFHGARAGVFGLGEIGFEIAKRLAGFNMMISYCARSAKANAGQWTFVPNAVALARESDFLFVAANVTPETTRIINRDVLEALGPKGVLINISRGALVDESALLDALENGKIGGAGLDVFDNEPNIDPRFFPLKNVMLAPHVGSGTYETRKAMGKLVRDNLEAHFAGKALLTEVVT
jgi:lactate dehydrogenase-like 2-hydroxyacid dehydrogenase